MMHARSTLGWSKSNNIFCFCCITSNVLFSCSFLTEYLAGLLAIVFFPEKLPVKCFRNLLSTDNVIDIELGVLLFVTQCIIDAQRV